MPTVLWNDRTTPLAVNGANTAFSSGLDLAWDFTGRDSAHMDGVPWKYVGATSPTLVKTGTHNLTTLAGEPCRVPVGASAANYDYTSTTNYGWQTGSGDFTIAIRMDTPAALPVASGNVEVLRISGSAGTAASLIVQEDAGNGWYLTITGSTTIPIGTQQTAQFFGVNTSFILWIRRTAGVVRVLTQNATAGTDAVIRRSDATATTDMDSTWAARTLLNFGNNVTCGLAALLHWNVAKSDADINAIGKNFWDTQANTISVADTTAPILSSPTGAATGNTTASASVTTDEPGTGYRLTQLAATAAPNAAAVKAASNSMAFTTGVQTFPAVTGLTPDALYKHYFVEDDNATTPNTSAVVASASFRTTGAVTFSGPVPTRNSVVGTAASFPNAGFFASAFTLTYTLQAGTLPPGLTLNASTGIVSGTPTTAGTYSGIVIRATDTNGNTADTNAYSSVVAATNAAPTFPGSIANITGTGGSAITPVNVSGQFSDTDALTYSASPAGTAWPSGLVVNASTGIISGTVATSTTTGLKVRATDTASQTVDSNAFSVTISAPASATFNFVAPDHVLGQPDSGALRTGLSTHVQIEDAATGAVLATKTGQSTHATTALPSNFTVSGLAPGAYWITIINDADANDRSYFKMTAV